MSTQVHRALSILVIEDDSLVISSLKHLLSSHRLAVYQTLGDFIKDTELPNRFDLVLLDLCHPADKTGEETLSLFPQLKKRLPDVEIIVQSGVKELGVMKRCLKLGANRFLLKDYLADELPILIESLLDRHEARANLETSLQGASVPMRELRRQLLDLKFLKNVDVLIEGETGSGKELCARALHDDGPFVAVNVSAVPKELFEAEFFGAEKGAYTGSTQARAGYFEQADQGTLFLDEIQSLDLSLQAKLLRVLETRKYMRVGSSLERSFSGRVVAASNVTLKDSVAQGAFREDLYYRLFQAKVAVPPLKARGDDIILLAGEFLSQANVGASRIKLTEDAQQFLRDHYDWPGNIRELKALMKRLAIEVKIPFVDAEVLKEFMNEAENKFSSLVAYDSSTMPESFPVNDQLSFDQNVTAFEEYLLRKALAGKSTQEAREKLKLSRTRFYEKLKTYKLGSKPNE